MNHHYFHVLMQHVQCNLFVFKEKNVIARKGTCQTNMVDVVLTR